MQNSQKGGRPQIWYNLDAIISIGYRINSKEATKFRIWSRGILKQYMRKGYVINKALLINGGKFTDEYFEQLLVKKSEIFGLLRERSMKRLQSCMRLLMIIMKMQK